MAKIAEVLRAWTFQGYWLHLDCGHQIKWTGKRPKEGAQIECPNHKPSVIYDAPKEIPRG